MLSISFLSLRCKGQKSFVICRVLTLGPCVYLKTAVCSEKFIYLILSSCINSTDIYAIIIVCLICARSWRCISEKRLMKLETRQTARSEFEQWLACFREVKGVGNENEEAGKRRESRVFSARPSDFTIITMYSTFNKC